MRHFYGFVGLPNHWADDKPYSIASSFRDAVSKSDMLLLTIYETQTSDESVEDEHHILRIDGSVLWTTYFCTTLYPLSLIYPKYSSTVLIGSPGYSCQFAVNYHILTHVGFYVIGV